MVEIWHSNTQDGTIHPDAIHAHSMASSRKTVIHGHCSQQQLPMNANILQPES